LLKAAPPCNGVPPLISRASIFAPLLRSTSITDTLLLNPLDAAFHNGVLPFSSRASIFAPLLSSNSTTAGACMPATRCNGVRPRLSLPLTFAPLSMSRETTAFVDALANRVFSFFRDVTLPLSSNNATMTGSPEIAAERKVPNIPVPMFAPLSSNSSTTAGVLKLAARFSGVILNLSRASTFAPLSRSNVMLCCKMQWSFTFICSLRIDFCSGIDQSLHILGCGALPEIFAEPTPAYVDQVCLVFHFCIVQRCLSAHICGADICAFGEEQYHDRWRAVRSGEVQWRLSKLILGVDICALVEQALDIGGCGSLPEIVHEPFIE